jgi:23S rRNA (uracil1939-C5)-methyltransferase
MSETPVTNTPDTDTVEILRIGHAGDGVTEEGLFVPYTVPGDMVRVSPDGKRARLAEVLRAGPARIQPLCRHFGRCGGCALQHVEMGAYLAWKREQVISALQQRGFDNAPVEDIRSIGPHTRRRATLKALKIGKRGAAKHVVAKHGVGAQTMLGFYEPESRNLVDVRACPVLHPALESLMAPLRAQFERILQPGEGAEIALTLSDTGIDAGLNLKRARGPDVLMDLAELADALKLARLAWNGEVVAEREKPAIRIGRAEVMLPVGAFLQPSREGEALLQALVREGVGDARNIADLFAGIGTFALDLAGGEARVTAYESDAAMVAALNAGAHLGGMKAEAVRRDLFARSLNAEELSGFDAVVLDPPRPGARAQAEALSRADVGRVVYVSCSPASFARDARLLCDGGFRLMRVTPVDQFLWSPHVEMVAVFVR